MATRNTTGPTPAPQYPFAALAEPVGRSFVYPGRGEDLKNHGRFDEIGNLLRSSLDIFEDTSESLTSQQFGALFLLRQSMAVWREIEDRIPPPTLLPSEPSPLVPRPAPSRLTLVNGLFDIQAALFGAREMVEGQLEVQSDEGALNAISRLLRKASSDLEAIAIAIDGDGRTPDGAVETGDE